MVEDPPLDIFDRASVSLARERVRHVARAVGFGPEDTERLALAVSELAQNQVDHARDGQISVREIERGGVRGVEIEAADRGPGIADLAGVLDGAIPGRGLGAGLPSVRRLAEELDADVRTDEGTVLRVRRFLAPVQRHPEVAIRGRGLERPSGDHAVVRRAGNLLVVAVIDGAGHGPPAREAAEIAAGEVHVDRGPATMMLAMHEALRRTRGASASVLKFDLPRQTVTVAGVGNVTVRITVGDLVTTCRPQPGLLGSRKIVATDEVVPFPARAAVHAFTDGISARTDVREIAGRSAIHIASRVFAAHVKDHDDALIAVVR